MAGALVTIGIDDRRVLAVLQELERLAANPAPALEDIAGHLLRSHEERWARQVDPSEQPWEPLSEAYAARKEQERPNAGILVFDEMLRRLHHQIDGSTLVIGTDRSYGATHQFGRGAIPARPFIGFSDEDESSVLDILSAHVLQALS